MKHISVLGSRASIVTSRGGGVRACALVAAAVTMSACSGSTTPGLRSATSSPTPTTPAATASLAGHILFTQTDHDDVQTYVLVQRATSTKITSPGAYCCIDRISPDHRQILVIPGGDIPPPVTGGTIDLSGGNFHRLSIPHGTLNLVPQAWSPDGSNIACEGWDDSNPSRTGLYTLTTDGTGLTRVTTRPGLRHDIPLDYSPDGRWLAFYRSVHSDPDPKTGGSLWVVRTNGQDAHRISSGAHPADWARWSPDGSKILFATERLATSGALWTVTPAGRHLTRIFAGTATRYPITPTWSPDGHLILFAIDPTNDEFTHPANALAVITSNGASFHIVLSDSTCKRWPEWWAG